MQWNAQEIYLLRDWAWQAKFGAERRALIGCHWIQFKGKLQFFVFESNSRSKFSFNFVIIQSSSFQLDFKLEILRKKVKNSWNSLKISFHGESNIPKQTIYFIRYSKLYGAEFVERYVNFNIRKIYQHLNQLFLLFKIGFNLLQVNVFSL